MDFSKSEFSSLGVWEGNLYFVFGLGWWFELFISYEGAGFFHSCYQAHLHLHGKAAVSKLLHRETNVNKLV